MAALSTDARYAFSFACTRSRLATAASRRVVAHDEAAIIGRSADWRLPVTRGGSAGAPEGAWARAWRPSARGSALRRRGRAAEVGRRRATSRCGSHSSEKAVPFRLLHEGGYGNALGESEAAVGAQDPALSS